MQCWSRASVQQIIGQEIGYSLIVLTKINVFLEIYVIFL